MAPAHPHVTGVAVYPSLSFKQFHWFLGYAICSFFLIASVGSTIAISYINKSGILFLDATANMEDLYIKPWIRISPYIIGMATGYLFHRFKKANRKTLPMPLVMVMWVLSAVVGCYVVYGLGHFYESGVTPTRAEAVSYLSLSRLVAPIIIMNNQLCHLPLVMIV